MIFKSKSEHCTESKILNASVLYFISKNSKFKRKFKNA